MTPPIINPKTMYQYSTPKLDKKVIVAEKVTKNSAKDTVPITYLDKFNPKQFEIIGLVAGNIKGLAGILSKTGKDGPYLDGKLKYGRILIRKIQVKDGN